MYLISLLVSAFLRGFRSYGTSNYDDETPMNSL